MAVILVVEPDPGFAQRIAEALQTEGLTAAIANDRDAALAHATRQAPKLVLVDTSVPDAVELLSAFAARRGGPGAMALVPAHLASSVDASEFQADAVIAKPFSDEDLRHTVRGWLDQGLASLDSTSEEATGEPVPTDATTPESASVPTYQEPKRSKRQLSSVDIFGDILAEVEAEADTPRSSSSSASASARSKDDDLQRKLEQTLSGVLGRSPAHDPPPKRKADTRDEVAAMLDQTLGALVQPDRTRRKPKAEISLPPPPVTPAATSEPSAADPSHITGQPPAPAASATPETTATPAETNSATPEPAAAASGLDAVFATQQLPTFPASDGESFGEYTLLDRIAVGGMAEVWKARRRGVEGFQKTVAIKRILSHLTGSPDFVTMFIDEAKLAAQLSHNHIAQIYDLGKVGDDFFIAMELVEGSDLRSMLTLARKHGRPLPHGQALSIAAKLGRALDYAHRKRGFDDRELGLVHRDISPQNVLISHEGDIKLCDFGIVKAVSKASHTQMGALKGKLQYMSPEQAWGKTVDARSDIFSLGAVLFEMLTEEKLFTGETEISVLDAVRDCRVQPLRSVRPDIGEDVERILMRALAKNPDERYQTAGQLAEDLEAAIDQLKPTPGQADLAAYMERLHAFGDTAAATGSAPSGESGAPSTAESGSPTPTFEPLPELPAPPPITPDPIAEPLPIPQADPRPMAQPQPEPQNPQSPAMAMPAAEGVPTAETSTPATAATTENDTIAELPATHDGESTDVTRSGEGAYEPVADAEPGKKGRSRLLVAALVLLTLAAIAWWASQRGKPGEGATATGPAPAAVAPTTTQTTDVPEPAPGTADADGDEAEGRDTEAAAAGDTPEDVVTAPDEQIAATEDTATDTADEGQDPDTEALNLERLVNEEMARRVEKLRQEFELERQQIEKELAATQSQADDESKENAPPTEGGEQEGDGESQPATEGGGGR